MVSMIFSSTCSSSIQIKSGPIYGDILWMQAKHVSEHVRNGEANRKLHIRRELSPFIKVKKKYQRKLFLYFDNLMGYLKINVSLFTALINIERWRPETHKFHMRCGECTITLQDVSVLLGLRNYWESDHRKVNFKAVFTRAWILRFVGGVLFVDKSSNKVSLRYLQFLCDFEQCSTATDYKIKSIGGMCILIQMWAWERCTTFTPKRTPPVIENKSLGHRFHLKIINNVTRGCNVEISILDIMKRHEFLWEPYTATVMSVLPPICLVGSVAWCAVVPLICFHVVEVLRQFRMQQPIPKCPSQPLNFHGITLKGKQDENWFQLLAPMISQWNNRVEFRVDVYPRQEGLLSFNSDYMVWYRRKNEDAEVAETLQYMVSPQGKNT
ncbi:Serine/threonine-protein phosphatase 7 long form [Glycine soja]